MLHLPINISEPVMHYCDLPKSLHLWAYHISMIFKHYQQWMLFVLA